jgi:hypothetical protein
MALSRFFKTPNHRQFDYIPRHWNPRKEDLEKRLESAQKKTSKDVAGMKARISGSMRRGGSFADTKRTRSSYIFRSNLMLLGIVIVLVAVSYLLFVQYLPLFLDSFGLEPTPANQ